MIPSPSSTSAAPENRLLPELSPKALADAIVLVVLQFWPGKRWGMWWRAGKPVTAATPDAYAQDSFDRMNLSTCQPLPRCFEVILPGGWMGSHACERLPKARVGGSGLLNIV